MKRIFVLSFLFVVLGISVGLPIILEGQRILGAYSSGSSSPTMLVSPVSLGISTGTSA